MNSTALGATAKKEGNLLFISNAHEKFYYEKLKEVRYQDVYTRHFAIVLISAMTQGKMRTEFTILRPEM